VRSPATWNVPRHIATGQHPAYDGRWWMFFHGSRNPRRRSRWTGPEPTTSPTWKTRAGARALPPGRYLCSRRPGAIRIGLGRAVPPMGRDQPIPYIYPEAAGRLVFISSLCSPHPRRAGREPAVALTHWCARRTCETGKAAGILSSWPHCFERMETPQLWPHEGRWYLSFGGVLNMPWVRRINPLFPTAVRGQRSHPKLLLLHAHRHPPTGPRRRSAPTSAVSPAAGYPS